MKHLRAHDVLIADPVNADFGSVETRAGNGVYGPVPEQDAHPAGPITPKLWIKGNFVGTLQGSPRSEESLRVSHRAFASTPGPAIGQHLCLVNLHIVGIAGEHALQIAVLDRSKQPADHRHLINIVALLSNSATAHTPGGESGPHRCGQLGADTVRHRHASHKVAPDGSLRQIDHGAVVHSTASRVARP